MVAVKRESGLFCAFTAWWWWCKICYFYRPQRSWAKVIFSQVSVCPQGGLPQCMLGYTPQDQTPQDQTPPHWEQTSRPEQTPLLEQTRPRKHTPAYGQRAAGTHPTWMHSCLIRKNTGKAEEFFSQCDNPVHTFSPLCVLTTLFSVLRFGFTSCVLWFNEARGDGNSDHIWRRTNRFSGGKLQIWLAS